MRPPIIKGFSNPAQFQLSDFNQSFQNTNFVPQVIQEQVTCQDVGPDLQHEGLQQPAHGLWPPQPAVASVQQQVQGPKYDHKGRELADCGCLKRTPPPPPPTKPPFTITPHNTDRIRDWLLDYYAASAFNNCSHQTLPLMSGLPPLRILTKPGAIPHVVNKPSVIPSHWLDQVKADLDQDVALGVLEKVPHNTPTTWCSRMHVVSKKNGKPRRVVDLRKLNEATLRQTHFTEPPFAQAMAIPPNTWRFSTDAWNGYHSVPIDPQDSHLTTFITPWGRMRYNVAPQGSISSGDGFTFWYDSIIKHLKRKKKCVDDVAGWASTLQQLFQDATEFLSLTAAHGIIQNADKFVWGRQEFEFLGFSVTRDGVKPSESTLKSIKQFPRPTDISGIRSWFGLVEQVSFAFSKSKIMEPFKPLLKKNSIFSWTQELQTSFDLAKEEIVRLVKDGVKSFKVGEPLCLVTDWSKLGLGYVLWQKRCACAVNHPSCCPDGWAVILCGSRYCTPAETRYHPIEGELLGVAWALSKTRQYTLGSPNLLLLVDHKPLLGLLKTRELGNIDNPRLQHLAEKLLPWSFDIQHISGSSNQAPDAFSRSPPQESGSLNVIDQEITTWSESLESKVAAQFASKCPTLLSWKTLQDSAISDENHASLLYAIHNKKSVDWDDQQLKDYKRYKDDMTSVNGVPIYLGRIVIPPSLRQQVLVALHRAHQGTTGMGLRAQESIWWPGYTNDLNRTRQNCSTCITNAPSQSALPPISPPTPLYPFQMVSSDYFSFSGRTYIVFVDRYSNWPVIKLCQTETARELISNLRDFFCTYGTPEELATDGGSSYMAATTQKFLANWGVVHRVSAAYNPRSNLRAETAVKSMKRLIARNIDTKGSLDTDNLSLALLQYRNTPDRDTGLSPAQILFARTLRDAVPCPPADLQLRPEWLLTAAAREKALSRRHQTRDSQLREHTKPLQPLTVGTVVQIQNQHGPHSNKWDLSGTIVEPLNFEAYLVKMDGSNRITKRNRRYLRPIVPYTSIISPSSSLPNTFQHFVQDNVNDVQDNENDVQDNENDVQDKTNTSHSTGLTPVIDDVTNPSYSGSLPVSAPTRSGPSSRRSTRPLPAATSRSNHGLVQLPTRPDVTHTVHQQVDVTDPDDLIQMSTQDFNTGLTQAVSNVRNQVPLEVTLADEFNQDDVTHTLNQDDVTHTSVQRRNENLVLPAVLPPTTRNITAANRTNVPSSSNRPKRVKTAPNRLNL